MLNGGTVNVQCMDARVMGLLEMPKFDLLCYSCFSFHASTTVSHHILYYIQINLTPFCLRSSNTGCSSSSIGGGGGGNNRRQKILLWNRALHVWKSSIIQKFTWIRQKKYYLHHFWWAEILAKTRFKWREQSQLGAESETFKTFSLASFAISRLSQAIIKDNSVEKSTEFSVLCLQTDLFNFTRKICSMLTIFRSHSLLLFAVVVIQVSPRQTYYQVLDICLLYYRTNVVVVRAGVRACGYIEN